MSEMGKFLPCAAMICGNMGSRGLIEGSVSEILETLIKLLTDYIINLNIEEGSEDWKYHTELMQIRDEMISSKIRLKTIYEEELKKSATSSSD